MTVGIFDMDTVLTTETVVEELIKAVLEIGAVLEEEIDEGIGAFVDIILVDTVLSPETGEFADEAVERDVAVYVSVTGDTTLMLGVCTVVAATVTLITRGKSTEDVELNAELGPETDV